MDPVLLSQRCYRGLLRATASPGLVVDLWTLTQQLGPVAPASGSSLCPATLLLALTLLDAEVTFHVAGPLAAPSERLVSQLTYARRAEAPKADFVLVPEGVTVADVLGEVSAGTLMDPHQGATLIVEAGEVRDDGPLVLSGPGIRSERRIGVRGGQDWVEARAARNAEYPMGVDLYFVDTRARLVALPRTTRLRVDA